LFVNEADVEIVPGPDGRPQYFLRGMSREQSLATNFVTTIRGRPLIQVTSIGPQSDSLRILHERVEAILREQGFGAYRFTLRRAPDV
jgi:hypothetical protein